MACARGRRAALITAVAVLSVGDELSEALSIACVWQFVRPRHPNVANVSPAASAELMVVLASFCETEKTVRSASDLRVPEILITPFPEILITFP